MLISPEQQTQPVHGNNYFNTFEILEDFEYFLPKNRCTFLFKDQWSFYKIHAVLKPFFSGDVEFCGVTKMFLQLLTWELSLTVPSVLLEVIAVGNHQMNE